jgi:hypothetical protein
VVNDSETRKKTTSTLSKRMARGGHDKSKESQTLKEIKQAILHILAQLPLILNLSLKVRSPHMDP